MLTTLEPFLTVTSPYRGYLTDEILCEDGNYIQIETADYYIALQVPFWQKIVTNYITKT